MIRSIRLLCLTLALVLLATCASYAQQPAFKVLAFYNTHTEKDHVDFAMQAIDFFKAMAQRDGFSFVATDNWDDLNPATLKQYQLVMWLDDVPAKPAQRTAFADYMDHGGGWLGFHISGFSESRKDWPWFADFMGTVFSGNSWPPLPATITVDDPSHPVMKGIPQSFLSPVNEWYNWQPSPRNSPNIKVLMTFAPSNYPLGLKETLDHGDIPVVWTNTKYRMLYANMGHGDRILTSKAQNQFFENAVLWLGNGAR